ncbi:MAG: hypothetical protein ACP5QO_15825 [Clostridia bacterium]
MDAARRRGACGCPILVLGTHFVYTAPWRLSAYSTLALMTTVGATPA